MLIKKEGKRLGIFFFYDKDGIVDGYVDYLLQNIMSFFEKLIVKAKRFTKAAAEKIHDGPYRAGKCRVRCRRL